MRAKRRKNVENREQKINKQINYVNVVNDKLSRFLIEAFKEGLYQASQNTQTRTGK